MFVVNPTNIMNAKGESIVTWNRLLKVVHADNISEFTYTNVILLCNSPLE